MVEKERESYGRSTHCSWRSEPSRVIDLVLHYLRFKGLTRPVGVEPPNEARPNLFILGLFAIRVTVRTFIAVFIWQS